MKKTVTVILAVCALAALSTGCNKKNGGSAESQTTTSQSVTTPAPETTTENVSTSLTGDVDGDGFYEEMGTDINDIVSDIVTDVSDIAGDIASDIKDDTFGGNSPRARVGLNPSDKSYSHR